MATWVSSSEASRPAGPGVLPAMSWRDRWLDWRNRLLASPVFQRRSAAFFLTRPVAHRRANELFDLVAGFVYSQVLLACVRLEIFDILRDGPQTTAALAPRLGLSEAACERLLEAASALRLLQRRSQGRYGLGVLGAPMVGNAALAAMVEHHGALYADLADPVAMLRAEPGSTRLAQYWPYAGAATPGNLPTEQVLDYTALMSASQPLVAQQILDAYPFARHRCLLDVGGGDGTFLTQVAARVPALSLQLFDLPAVAARARQRLMQAGIAGRTRVSGGSFLSDPLPTGADIATLVRVVHDHDDERVLALLKAVHRALAPHGTLLVAEPMADTAGAQAMGSAYFGIYLQAMGRGQPRTEAQLTRLLRAAGFGQIQRIATSMPLQTSLLMAKTESPEQPYKAGVNND